MKLTGVPISSDEFICYKILHAVLRDNHLELICTLRELSDVQVITQYLLRSSPYSLGCNLSARMDKRTFIHFPAVSTYLSASLLLPSNRSKVHIFPQFLF